MLDTFTRVPSIVGVNTLIHHNPQCLGPFYNFPTTWGSLGGHIRKIARYKSPSHHPHTLASGHYAIEMHILLSCYHTGFKSFHTVP